MKNPIILPEKMLLVKSIPGYSPNISRLICMMNYARLVTLRTVEGLAVKDLDFQLDENSNSIGALLLHIASVEYFYQKVTFEEREPTEEEDDKWKPAIELGKLGRKKIKGNDLEYYLNIMDELRNQTYELMKEKDDKWLHKESEIWGKTGNNYFMWFHMFEDEINHRGQINLIKKRIKK